ncbi:unnamed protein product [Hapterophycus canaliculatus]
MVVSSFLAMAYCCRTKVLALPSIDYAFPSAVSGDSGYFETENHFFDFSGVNMMPLAEYEVLSSNPLVCQPHLEEGGESAFLLRNIHADLLSCMNRVYVRGCEAAYLEPILGAGDFSYCTKPAGTNNRRLLDGRGRQTAGAVTTAATPIDRGNAGSLVIHIRSGDIFRALLPGKTRSRDFFSFGQPPLEFYLRAIASRPWSDVTILTFSLEPEELNPTFAALEMLGQTGMLGPNVTAHKARHRDRDLLTDIRSMLCADGLAISRSTLHFLTFAHTRAKYLFVPSECGPGSYTRGQREDRATGKKKPNPNNTTLLCIENPDTEVYGVDWMVDEAAYSIYNRWNASPAQQRDMVLFDGVKRLSRCCLG